MLVGGTAITLTVFFTISLPLLLGLLGNAIRNLAIAESPAAVLDSLVVVTFALTFQSLWARAWWRRHGIRVKGALAKLAGWRRG